MSATHKAIYNSALPRWLKDIASAFACFEDYEEHTLYPSVEHVAWMLDLDREEARQVKRATKELRRLGVLKRLRRHWPGHPTLYLLDVSALPKRDPFVPRNAATGVMDDTCDEEGDAARQVTLATEQVSPVTQDLPERTTRKIKITGAARRRSLAPVENVASKGHYTKIALEAIGLSLTRYESCRYSDVVGCFKDLCAARGLNYEDPTLPERAINAAVGSPRVRAAVIPKTAQVHVARYPSMSRRDVEQEVLKKLNVLFSEKRLTAQEQQRVRSAVDDAWNALGEFGTAAVGVA